MKFKLSYTVLLAAAIVAMVVVFEACKKDEPPRNPYSDIDYGDTIAQNDTVNPFSITGLHRNIFQVKCANPGCHDGNFEPDFRTVQSTYLSLVYHPLIKTDSTGYFTYRVKPYDTARSWLHERLVTDDQVLGRMPLYADPLNATEMNQINTWIMNGAPNEDGTRPTLPNEEPTSPGFYCLNMSNVVVDTNRLDDVPYNPFILAPNTQYQIAFVINDDSTAMADMQNVKVRFNTAINGFPTGATAYQAFFVNFGQLQFWRVIFNTSSFTPGQQVYFRLYFNDGDHQTDTEFPRTNLNDAYKSYFSFIVQ